MGVMATHSARQLREKTDQELQALMSIERKRVFDAMVRGASGESIKPHQKREARKLIAKIQTVLSERRVRRQLVAKIQVLEPKAGEAKLKWKRVAARPPRPQLPPIRVPGRKARLLSADRAALCLAEAHRLRAALHREDPGEGK
jgi:ribosomal protein L29